MSKKLNKIIMDDFNKTYSIELDKEKIYKNIQAKEEKEDNIQTVLYLKRLCKRISVAACLIIVCLISIISIMLISDHRNNVDDIVTKEFQEYMEEYTGVSKYSINSFFQLKENIYINIYAFYRHLHEHDREQYPVCDPEAPAAYFQKLLFLSFVNNFLSLRLLHFHLPPRIIHQVIFPLLCRSFCKA